MRSSSLVACLHLSALPIAAHHSPRQTHGARSYAVHRGRGRTARILFCDTASSRSGIRPGQTLSAAKARNAELQSRPFDQGLIHRHQQLITTRLLRLSPRITHGGPSRIWVEPQQNRRLSLDRWCQLTREALADHPPVAIGVAPTSTIAWAAARSIEQGHRIIEPQHAQSFLDDCPIEVLDIGSEPLSVLLSLGVRSVQQLRALDPLSLNARFGPDVSEARRRAEGWDPTTPQHPRLHSPLQVEVETDAPISSTEALFFLISPATEQLMQQLRAQQLAAREVILSLVLEEGAPPFSLKVATAQSLTDARSLLEMLRTRIERASLSAGVMGFRLIASQTDQAPPQSERIFSSKPSREPAAEEVALDRLRHRLGAESVRRATHQERALQLERAAWCVARAPRRGQAMPWRGVSPPARLRAGRVDLAGRSRRVIHLGRVERLASPWWEEAPEHIEMLAWAELEGPLLVLLHGRRGSGIQARQDDIWEVVAWVD